VNTPDKSVPAKVRQAYHSPQIRYYGAIGAITQAVGNMSMNSDGGSMMTSKTL